MNIIHTWLCTDLVLLSDNAFKKYQIDWSYSKNCNVHKSRILLDDVKSNFYKERKFFSYVGNVVATKKIDWFLKLGNYMKNNNIDEELMIISSSELPMKEILNLKKEGLKISVINDKKLSDQEISNVLKKSKSVFCLHKGISQSGVFVEAMRHKTPIIGLRQEGLIQFFNDCGVLINDPFNPEEIIKAFEVVNKNFDKFSDNALSIFEKEFSSRNFIKYYNFLIKD